ncbi:MAG: hypothetical protein BMS9Abin28_1255 [Anaerolineae bacterium]|nr:MAG: hypothetical protein BMS9Abin28_1255 [Anaerolineae bacterium]
MSKQRTHPNNGPEPSGSQPSQRGEEHPSVSASLDHQTEAEETTQREVDHSSTKEERGASEALMESYNG